MSGSRASRWAVAAAAVAATTALVVGLTDDDSANGGKRVAAPGWSKLPASPLSRSEVGGARVGDQIYVAGGFIAGAGETTDQVARYDISEGTWELAPPMPIAVNHPAVASFGGQIYVHGGYASDAGLSGEIDSLQRFDPATGQWTELAPSGFPRAAHVLIPARGTLWAIGGAHDGGKPLGLVQVYDPASGTWSAGPQMPTAREHIAAAALGPQIYVLGGRVGSGNLAAAERLDTRKGRWKKISKLRTPRSGFGAAAVGRSVVAIGGEELRAGGTTIAPVEVYDTRSKGKRKRWRKLPRMITPRHGLAVVAAGRRIFALEGGPEPALTFSPVNEMLLLPAKEPRPKLPPKKG
jgi:hypothetical protein